MGILHDGVHKLGFLLGGIGVVKTQVQFAAKVPGDIVINQERLDVPDVQVAVGFGGQAGAHIGKAPGAQVFRHSLVDKIGWFGGFVCHPAVLPPGVAREIHLVCGVL